MAPWIFWLMHPEYFQYLMCSNQVKQSRPILFRLISSFELNSVELNVCGEGSLLYRPPPFAVSWLIKFLFIVFQCRNDTSQSREVIVAAHVWGQCCGSYPCHQGTFLVLLHLPFFVLWVGLTFLRYSSHWASNFSRHFFSWSCWNISLCANHLIKMNC